MHVTKRFSGPNPGHHHHYHEDQLYNFNKKPSSIVVTLMIENYVLLSMSVSSQSFYNDENWQSIQALSSLRNFIVLRVVY